MFDKPYRAAVVQMNSQTDLDQNFEQAYGYIRQAVKAGALAVGLPENFAFLGGLSMRMERGAEIAKRTPDFLAKAAREFEIYLLGGSYPIPTSEGKVFNHSALYGPRGQMLASYNKIHLFDVKLSDKEAYRESDYVQSGDAKPVLFNDENVGNWGLSICYDLRFPELYRKLAKNDAQILSVPSAFTYTTGKDHWELLLRARAIENTSYVFAPAQTGLHGKNRRTWGHAMIINPWGKIIADAGQEPGFAVAEIDPQTIHAVRRKIPSLQHRRIK